MGHSQPQSLAISHGMEALKERLAHFRFYGVVCQLPGSGLHTCPYTRLSDFLAVPRQPFNAQGTGLHTNDICAAIHTTLHTDVSGFNFCYVLASTKDGTILLCAGKRLAGG